MASSRKGGGMTMIYISLLVLYFFAAPGRYLLFCITGTPSRSQLVDERRRRRGTRRITDDGGGSLSNEKTMDHEIERRKNDFVVHFDDTLSRRDYRESYTHTSDEHFAPLILKKDQDGMPRLYCRESQMKSLSRGKYFVQMLREGLMRYPMRRPLDSDIPISIKHDDSNGCYPATRSDRYGFPRLTWSIPANMTIIDDNTLKSSREEGGPSSYSTWCSAIGMPSYKIWKEVNKNKEGVPRTTMSDINPLYPWSDKIQKAVWRGSTTCNKGMYGHLPLWDIPRSRLVKSSLERPDLIDASFHKLVGKYASIDGSPPPVILKDPVPLNDMTKYKAIIDIDGNNWSARFPSLLCTNSIIIKITPDFVDQYTYELVPNVHYVPSSLENITQVVEHVLDPNNDVRMRNIVEEANKWCRLNLRRESFAIRALRAFDMYRDALERYGVDAWKSPVLDDLVECDV
ncbi:hypothetical protein ACHAXA_008674 [Cyclostephanos tholiformis]|uniref:Glycosyl transferase CAP10 domain-containing protein n=1 Tax=Cyclostephanos tholiformis TaxID=382380 RepID=A0ABD3RX54_9STRA